MATDPYEEFRNVVPKIVADEAKLDQWINGGENDTVQTSGGPIPTWRGIVKSVETQATDQVNEIIVAGGQIFPDEATGRAAVQDGQYYYAESTSSSAALDIYQRVDSTTSRLVSSVANGDFVEDIQPVVDDFKVRESGYSTLPAESTEWEYAVGDLDGRVAIGIDPDGKTHIQRNNEYDRDSAEFVTGWTDEDGNLSLGIRKDGTVYAGGLDPISRNIVQPRNKTLKVVYAIGQSLSVGGGQNPNETTPELAVVSNPPRGFGEYCIMMDIGTRNQYASPQVPLTEERVPGSYFEHAYESYNGNTNGETHGTGLLERILVDSTLEDRDTYLFRTGGRGGRPYAELAKGSRMYDFSIQDLRDIVRIASSHGWGVEVVAVTVTHGEADRNAGTVGYLGLLQQWKSDYTADIKSITGQSLDPDFFPDQLSNPFSGGPLSSQIMQDFYDWSDMDPKVHLVTPKYFLPNIDNLHLLAEGYRQLGEYHGRAIHEVVNGEGWSALKPISITLTGNVVDVVFNSESQIVIDTENVDPQGNFGFSWPYPPVINSVEVVGQDTIRITLNVSPDPAGSYMLNYAFDVRKGNVRDSSPGKTLTDGLPLYKWAASFNLPVTIS